MLEKFHILIGQELLNIIIEHKHNLNLRKGRYYIIVVSDKQVFESLNRSANTMKINEIELNELDQVIEKQLLLKLKIY